MAVIKHWTMIIENLTTLSIIKTCAKECETYGAPKNPFSMAARYKQNPNDTADSSTNAIKHDQVW